MRHQNSTTCEYCFLWKIGTLVKLYLEYMGEGVPLKSVLVKLLAVESARPRQVIHEPLAINVFNS